MEEQLSIAMFSIHSCPVGELGTKDTGGMNVYIRELATELGNRGHRVDIYTRIHDPQDPTVIHLNENARVIHLKAGKNGYMHKLAIYPYLEDFTGAMEEFMLKEGLRYDIVHSHYWLSGQVGRWAQNRWQVPHVLMFHTLGAVKNASGVGEQEPLLRITTEKKLVEHCHRIIAATHREKIELMRYYGANPEKMRVIPCGVNLSTFQPIERAAARKKLGLQDDEKIILFVGRFTASKGIERLLDAMTYLKHHPKLKLVIIGGDGHDAPDSVKLKKLSLKLGVSNMTKLVGRVDQDNLPPYYCAADLLAVSSYHESFGLVALESLACGTPVVATEVGAMGAIIDEGKTGHILADDSPAGIAKALDNYFLERCDKVASAGTIRASVRKYSWSFVADAMIAEYLSLRDEYEDSSPKDLCFQAALF